MEELYYDVVTERAVNKAYGVKPTDEYDDYFQKADEALEKLRGKHKEVPEVEKKFQNVRDPWQGRQQTGYIENQDRYCEIKRRESIQQALAGVAQMPPEMIVYHDAIFVEGEPVENPEIKLPPKGKSYWWDRDVLEEEFRHRPGLWSSIQEKIDWYLGQTQDDQMSAGSPT